MLDVENFPPWRYQSFATYQCKDSLNVLMLRPFELHFPKNETLTIKTINMNLDIFIDVCMRNYVKNIGLTVRYIEQNFELIHSLR